MWRLRGWMTGRNGLDILSRDLSWLALILMLLSTFTRFYPLYLLGLLVFVVSMLRVFSRNLPARHRENARYYSKRALVLAWFSKRKRRFDNRKFYRYYTCPSCRQELRIPKRGARKKIEITCPKCKYRFIRRG